MTEMTVVERWGRFEVTLRGADENQTANPFLDVTFGARFQQGHRSVPVDGFYDGGGVYRVRFMPDTEGAWTYTTFSSRPELDGKSGSFTVTPPSAGNHGPVGVHETYHLAYADGTPYYQVGTTCYAWTHQGAAMEEQTLETLKSAPFNKMRMCLFPKHYRYNANDPQFYPFVPAPPAEGKRYGWDTTRFDPAYWHNLERRIEGLLGLGIEADLILFHPYDRWGFAEMDAESDDRYLRYAVARLAAYRNVWWSMANEWDLMRAKTMADWDRFFKVVQTADPYQHLRGVHNCHVFYDHAKPWVTHLSIQISNFNMNLEQARDWRAAYKKPMIIDECCYEGNIVERWGNIPPQEMVRRFWEGTLHGAYVGHGETYRHPDDLLWWAKGGILRGESPSRIAFYRDILAAVPPPGLQPVDGVFGGYFKGAGVRDAYYLAYTGVHQPGVIDVNLPDGEYTIDVIDTWGMTIDRLPGTYSGTINVELPSKPYIAVQVRKITSDT